MFKLLAKNIKKQQWLWVVLVVLLIVLQVWLELEIPSYMSEITVLIQTTGNQISSVLIAGAKMLVCAIASAITAFIVGFFVARISASVSKELRTQIFNKVQSFSSAEIKSFSTSSLIIRSTNDITQIQNFLVMGFSSLIKAPVMAIWAIVKISGKSWQWSVATFIAVVFLFAVIGVCLIIVLPKFRRMQTLTDNINRVTRENLIGLRVVRAYNAEGYQEEKFEKANNDLTQNSTSANRVMAIFSPTMSAIMSFLPLAIYWIGAYLINAALPIEKLTLFSDMVVFSSYAIQVVMSFVLLVVVFIMLPRASVSAKRINEVLSTESSIVDGEGVTVDEQDKGTIKFDNVSFKYENANEYILKDINFSCKKGDVVAFIGSTGSGKSTLINLVPRFYDATEGTVYVDGKDIKDYKLKDLRDRIGYVSQRAVLFTGDIMSNVTLGREGKKPDAEQVSQAIDISQSSDFVSKTGLNAHISQGGKNVSGGQKQRLSIARAIAKKPEILIFDDSFSALDYKTDKQLRAALNKEMKDTTILIVAQRIGTIKDADQIVVLKDGEMVGVGKHEDLLSNCEVYKEIALSQLSEEELKNAKR